MDNKITFFTAKEAAQLLRTTIVTLAKWRSQGTGPDYVKVANKVLYSEAAINEFLENKTVKIREVA